MKYDMFVHLKFGQLVSHTGADVSRETIVSGRFFDSPLVLLTTAEGEIHVIRTAEIDAIKFVPVKEETPAT